jgi:signal transduction histidine kinase
VTDTGVGLKPENQKKLFKEIVQFDPEKLQGTALPPLSSCATCRLSPATLTLFPSLAARPRTVHVAGGGSGFGVFICKGIVDLHKGKLSVWSEGEVT